MSTGDSIDVAATQESGTLMIDGVLMHRLAFAVLDPTVLWEPPKQRGADLLIPGEPGKQPLPRMLDSMDKSLRMAIDGRWDPFDAAVTNSQQGLLVNVLWLRAHVTDPPGTTDGTRHATLTSPDGSVTYGADVIVGGITVGSKDGPLWRATLDLTIPAGTLTPE